MLSRPQDFAALQAGTVRSHPLLTARFLRTDLETTRFGLATGRKLGSAVVRNRVRRRLREGLRAMAPSFQPGWDVLIIADRRSSRPTTGPWSRRCGGSSNEEASSEEDGRTREADRDRTHPALPDRVRLDAAQLPL
jgi:ribonuclease P protein component